MPSLEDLTVDQQRALRSAAVNLHREFGGVFGTETIEQFLVTSYDQFAANARIHTFLPLMAERFARQRLKALAKVEGKASDGLPVVLFLCVHNAGRSQMALGWFNHLAGGRAVGLVRRFRAGQGSQPLRGAGHGRGRHQHRPGVPQTLDRRDRARRRRRRHDGLRRRLPAASRASATKTGTSTTPPARTSKPCDPSVTRSNNASAPCWTQSTSKSPDPPVVGAIAFFGELAPQ